jgi:hypothetical protein
MTLPATNLQMNSLHGGRHRTKPSPTKLRNPKIQQMAPSHVALSLRGKNEKKNNCKPGLRIRQ